MKRDAQLNLRLPAALKEAIRQLAAAEGRKTADKAVRMLEQQVKAARAKEKEVPMKTAIGLALLLFAGAAQAVQPALCAAMCKKINARTDGMHCRIAVQSGQPVTLFLVIPKWGDADPDRTVAGQTLTECFFAARGQHMEISAPNDATRVMSCWENRRSESGYSCSGIPAKESIKAAFAEAKK